MKRWLIVLAVFLFACSTTGVINPSDLSLERRVEGNRIFLGDEPYAELILLCKDDFSDRYKGIAIHYLKENRYEWISPKKGWALIKDGQEISDIDELAKIWAWDRSPGFSSTIIMKGSRRVKDYKTYNLIDWRWDVKISEDGFSIDYVEGRLLGPRDRKYTVR